MLSDPRVIEAYLGHRYVKRQRVVGRGCLRWLACRRDTAGCRCCGTSTCRSGRSEIVALVGPNGAGKTTLLRALSGMIPISAGHDRPSADRQLGGRSIEQIVDLGIAHVPEGRRLFPGLSVRDNLRLGGWRIKNRDIDSRRGVVPAAR